MQKLEMEGNLQEKQNKKNKKTEQSESAHSKLICMFSLDYILTSDIIPDTEIPYSCWWSVCVGVGVWNFESPKEIQTGLWEDDVWLKSHLWPKFFFFFFSNFFLRFFFFFERNDQEFGTFILKVQVDRSAELEHRCMSRALTVWF